MRRLEIGLLDVVVQQFRKPDGAAEREQRAEVSLVASRLELRGYCWSSIATTWPKDLSHVPCFEGRAFHDKGSTGN